MGTPVEGPLQQSQPQTCIDGQDIVELCMTLTTLAKKEASIPLSVPLAARVAFLVCQLLLFVFLLS